MPFTLKLTISILATLFFTVSALPETSFAFDPIFAVARTNTPVLNTPDFNTVFGGIDGRNLKKDACGQLRSLEFIAMPETLFRIEDELNKDGRKIYRVTTDDYPYPSKNGFFVESDFVRLYKDKPRERPRNLPSEDVILARLKSADNSRYVWGGNVAKGVQEMLERYPAGRNLPPVDRDILTMHGVDCSGLLYEATGGFTPRNTSSLVNYGSAVKISGKSLRQISADLKPLDLIVWPGHVMIVIDGGKVIESRLVCSKPENGVRIRGINEALTEIMKKRKPADLISSSSGEFVVRRWYQLQP